MGIYVSGNGGTKRFSVVGHVGLFTHTSNYAHTS